MTSYPPPPATPPPPPGGGSYTPPPPPAGGGVTPSGDRTLMLVLSYLGILAFIPFLMKKDDREVQWHAKNGLVILGAEIILIILLVIIGKLPFGGCIAGPVWCIVPIGFLVIAILGIVKAVGGQRFKIPGLSDFADKF